MKKKVSKPGNLTRTRNSDLYAVVANGAVGTAGGPVKLAGYTPLHADGDAVDLHVAVERGSKVVVSVLVRICYEANKTNLNTSG